MADNTAAPATTTSLAQEKETSISSPEKGSVNDDLQGGEVSSSTADGASKDIEKKEDAAEDTSNYPRGFKLITLIIALCLAVLLVALDQTIIATAIPKITDHFNSISDIGWYGSAYFLTSTSLQPTFGRIYTVFNVCLYCPRRNFLSMTYDIIG